VCVAISMCRSDTMEGHLRCETLCMKTPSPHTHPTTPTHPTPPPLVHMYSDPNTHSPNPVWCCPPPLHTPTHPHTHRRAKYSLEHLVRVNLAGQDKAYRCVYQEEDENGEQGLDVPEYGWHVCRRGRGAACMGTRTREGGGCQHGREAERTGGGTNGLCTAGKVRGGLEDHQ
jgi:hypothetical protein